MNEKISHILKSPWTIPSAVGVASFGIGVGVGYILGKRQTEKIIEVTEFEELEFDFDVTGMAEETEKAKRIIDEEAYVAPVLAPETDAEVVDDTIVVRADPASALIEEHLEDPVVETEPEVEDELEEPEEELVQVNVFEDHDDDWDWDAEVTQRDQNPGKPYQLHQDEYYRMEFDFPQLTLTYFEGDNILVDENNEPIYNHHDVVGDFEFGHGSNNKDICFVRNDARRAEYEIIRHTGMYSREVLGIEIEDNARARDLQHSKVGRFRMD